MEHHDLDPYPFPKEKAPLFINEPVLVDQSLTEISDDAVSPKDQSDNIRVYVPLDISKQAILRRLSWVINRMGEATERNESDYCLDVQGLISQIEIYDQIWFVRHMPACGRHSKEAIALVAEFVEELRMIPDGGAELFPFSEIEELEREYLGIS